MRLLWLFAVVLLLCSSCYYQKPIHDDRWDLSQGALDSLNFVAKHHYSRNYNFLVSADSLGLQIEQPMHNETTHEDQDSVWVYGNNRLVVADILIIPEDSVDSVWVKVARDQLTMGWLHERTLLRHVVPSDSISQFIHLFSNRHSIYFWGIFTLVCIIYLVRRIRCRRFRVVHFDDVGSCYPALLCMVMAGAATLYASIQQFVPQTWVEFYFHPTLNPLNLPLILGLFIASVWMIAILAIASIEDVYRQLERREAVLYLCSLLGMCVVCYSFFSVATLYYVGYPCLLAYWAMALYRYYKHGRCKYRCGKCGTKMRNKGECSRCGAFNS